MEEPQAVCPFGKTKYDSRIFDRIYRVYGTEDGGTVLSAYWENELKVFKIEVPYQIIKTLIEGNEIGTLCYNYDWKEQVDVSKSLNAFFDNRKKSFSNREKLLDIASRIPCGSVRELFDNAEKIREWLER